MENLLSKKQVLKITGLSYPKIWRMMRWETFPRPLVLGEGAAARVAWKESEVMAWIESLPRQKYKPIQPGEDETRPIPDEVRKQKKRRPRQ